MEQELTTEEIEQVTLFICQCSASVSPFKDYNLTGPAKEHYLGNGMSRLKFESMEKCMSRSNMISCVFSCFESGSFPLKGTIYDYVSSPIWLEKIETHRAYFELKGVIYKGYRSLYNYIPRETIKKAWTFLSESQTAIQELYYFDMNTETVWEGKRPGIGSQYHILKSLGAGVVSEITDYFIKAEFLSEFLGRPYIKGSFDTSYVIPPHFEASIKKLGKTSPAMKMSLPAAVLERLEKMYLG